MLELDNPALVQNALCDQLGTPAVLVPNEELGSQSGGDFAATIAADGDYYAVVTNSRIKDVTVSWPDRKKTFENVDRGYLLDLGTCYQGDLIQMQSETEGQDLTVELYRFDYDALEALYERLAASPLKLSVWEDAALAGSVTVDPSASDYLGQTAKLFLSIPYDEGWEATVDGKPAALQKCFDTFLGLELSAGSHEIELRYRPAGLVPGAAVTGGSLLLLLLLALWERRKKKAERITAAALPEKASGRNASSADRDEEPGSESEEKPNAESDEGPDSEPDAEQEEEAAKWQQEFVDEPEAGSEMDWDAKKQSGATSGREAASGPAFSRREGDLLTWLEEKEDLPGVEAKRNAEGLRNSGKGSDTET